jgi:hypothetical protein
MEKRCTCLSCPANVINSINGAIENTVEEMEEMDRNEQFKTLGT